MKQGGGEQTLTVALRIRPLNEDEIHLGAIPIGHKVDNNIVVLEDPSDDPDDILRANRSKGRNYIFDNAFDGLATQTDVYTATTKVLIPNVISGYNATVFAYGATGAGKTYTMLGTDDEPGIMARTLNDLFLEMDKTKKDMVYKVTMSYLEIYNEMIRDLLNPTSGILDLREDAKGGVQVAGLSEVTATSTSEVMKMLMMGNLERTQEPTAANCTSSRSHAVLQVNVHQRNRIRDISQEVRNGRLFLIDLAGSERAANTHNRGKRMVEGAHINRSLLALGNCINALSGNSNNADKSGSRYVNYRDSKLTRLLKDALGGNCKTVMIAHISPASIHFEESRNTLVYADRAKHIRTKVHRNVTDVSYHIAQYSNIIAELKEEINRLKQKVQDQSKQYSVANIQEVHTEILSGNNDKEQLELAKLKEQMLVSFKEQMEYRRNLMELTNSSMEISLEASRNQLIISEWEADRTRKKREYSDDEKDSVGSGSSPEPDEVRIARDELKVLTEEKQRTEKLRIAVQKELDAAKAKVNNLQETLPTKVNQKRYKEILQLLCRVHQLEIENMELQSECFIRDFQIRKKDMIITRYKLHKSLCDEIIQQQKAFIDENKLSFPKELEDLFDLYTVETGDGMLSRDNTHSSFLLQKSVMGQMGSKHTLDVDQWSDGGTKDSLRTTSKLDIINRSSENLANKEESRLFRLSAKAKQLKQIEVNKLDGIHDTSLTKTPSPSTDTRVTTTPEDRQTIANRTRNIHVLAAKKRNKAQLNLLNYDRQQAIERTLHRLSPPTDLVSDSETYVSPSRLMNLASDNINGDKRQPSFESGNPSSVDRGNIHVDNRFRNTVIKDRKHRVAALGSRVQGNAKRRSHYRSSEQIHHNTQVYQSMCQYNCSNNIYNNHGSFQLPRPMRINRKVPPIQTKNVPSGSDVTVKTPKTQSKKHPPTIPSYRKGDIAVTGYSYMR